MATLSEILRWVTGTVLDRTPERDEIPRVADLTAWQSNCPDPAQAEAREAVAAMRLIGPDAEWTRDPLSALLAPGAPDMPPVEDWRWQAMDSYEWKAMEAALRERIGGDVDALLGTLESLGAIVRRPRPVFRGRAVQASRRGHARCVCVGKCRKCISGGSTCPKRTGPGIRSPRSLRRISTGPASGPKRR